MECYRRLKLVTADSSMQWEKASGNRYWGGDLMAERPRLFALPLIGTVLEREIYRATSQTEAAPRGCESAGASAGAFVRLRVVARGYVCFRFYRSLFPGGSRS